MLDNERGKIRNRQQATQVRDFSNLRWNKITPTDIDGFVEFGDILFCIIEVKHGQSGLPGGQRLAIERVVDAIEESKPKGKKRKACGIIASHNSSGDIDVGNCMVTEFRFQHNWHTPITPLTVRQAIDILRKKYVAPF